MILLGFPIELWPNNVFIYIINTMGIYIFLKEKSLFHEFKCLAWMLVENDLNMGHPADIEIHSRKKTFSQRLNLWKLPFCCHFCRHMGHLKRNYPSLTQYTKGEYFLQDKLFLR